MPTKPETFSQKIARQRAPWLNKAKRRESIRNGRDTTIQNSARWRRVRKIKLNTDPLCERCGKPAQCVHHIKERRDDESKIFDMSNLESLCNSCHSQETRKRQLEKERDD
jgi:5-methylcytosine-specific restriction endonuclease McrA